ncbi:MAG: 3-phosphoshikimate 1-carboxyvinyltransferase [Bacteroidota bacterium]
MYRLSRPPGKIAGQIDLIGSKSISNRALIIRALADEPFEIEHLAEAKDTQQLRALLASDGEVLDAGPAGTTYRFMTAYLCTRPGSQVLTGSERMLQRPIGILVDALRVLGADIEYLGEEGYPPLRIGYRPLNRTSQISIDGGTSSQFISALLLIAPTLPNGLTLDIEGKLVSKPYVDMTLALMRRYGIDWKWTENAQAIVVNKGTFAGGNLYVEADWSAASYYYAIAAIAEEADLFIGGLREDSLQGDSALAKIYEKFGIETVFEADGIHLRKPAWRVHADRSAKTKSDNEKNLPPAMIEQDFLLCPDIAQTISVTCAALGTQGLFSGLETLRIKETDRIAALQAELAKVGVFLSKLPPRLTGKSEKTYYLQEGHAQFDAVPRFDTYHDHRMAMAFAPLAMLGEIEIEDPMVVVKSYPRFYEDLSKLGFVISS